MVIKFQTHLATLKICSRKLTAERPDDANQKWILKWYLCDHFIHWKMQFSSSVLIGMTSISDTIKGPFNVLIKMYWCGLEKKEENYESLVVICRIAVKSSITRTKSATQSMYSL